MDNKMTLSEELQWRGFVNQTTLDDIEVLNDGDMTFYWGVDPSGPGMTIGHLAVAMMIKMFIDTGHDAILLVGGATGVIGDPDGKKQERDLKTLEEIEANKQAIAAQYRRIFDGLSFDIVDNYDWFKDVNYLDFLREVGKNMSMTQLLDREFVQSRVGEGGSGISYAEFSYSLIQGYDFLHLLRERGATLQVAGADQWGNSLAGVELIRKLEGKSAHVYTVPLIIDPASGKKFGKSEGNAVWLDPQLTTPYDFYQFWLNTDDESVDALLKIYTSITPEEHSQLMEEFEDNPADRAAQKYLAYEVTKLIHGQGVAQSVQTVSEVLFGDKDFQSLESNQVLGFKDVLPVVVSDNIVDALVESDLAQSKSEARRFIEQNAVSINGESVETLDSSLEDFADVHGHQLLRRGKNSFAIIER
jgi:tyrosyl-tRNA synthetase